MELTGEKSRGCCGGAQWPFFLSGAYAVLFFQIFHSPLLFLDVKWVNACMVDGAIEFVSVCLFFFSSSFS